MHRWSFALLTVAAPLALWACSHSPQLKTLTVDDVAARITASNSNTFVFDDNNHDRYRKGHLPGAKWIATSEPTAADLPADKGATLIFYCANEL
jgi:rhodanese-related sulfurtransferase